MGIFRDFMVFHRIFGGFSRLFWESVRDFYFRSDLPRNGMGFCFFQDGSKLMNYQGQDHRQGDEDFFRKTFFWKKGGQKLFFDLKQRAEFFFQKIFSQNRPRYPVNFDRSLTLFTDTDISVTTIFLTQREVEENCFNVLSMVTAWRIGETIHFLECNPTCFCYGSAPVF